MTRTEIAEKTCKACGASCEVCIYGSVNVTVDPELKPKVLDGSLFGHDCPECGDQSLLCYNTLYHDMDQRLQIAWRPEGDEPDPIGAVMFEGMPGGEPYQFRWVERGIDLAEKIRVFDAGLDDRALELTKLLTLAQIAEGEYLQGALTFVGVRRSGFKKLLDFERLDVDETVSVPFGNYKHLTQRYRPILGPTRGWQKFDQTFALRVVEGSPASSR